MAYTKIHAIKATVDKAIDYICNPEKTDEKMFVSSYACSPETAAYDFKYTLDHCRENSPNKAYHLIQAFAPGEVGFEEAHRIGKELADKLLVGKYSYVVTTHIDKGHVHNHIIFCAADNIEHNKYHDCKQSYYHIRKLSDELCKEHNLSVIIPGAQRGSAKSLGKEYTKEHIRERIERKREQKAVIPKRDYSARRLIDTSDEKFRSSLGLQRWAAIENLKIAAQSYNEVGSLAELEHKIALKTEVGKSAKQSVVELEHRIKDLAEIIKYVQQYKNNRSYHIGYKKAKNPDAYFRRYESQIILYGGARRMLEQAGINLKGLNVDKLKAEYQELMKQKSELTSTYKDCEKEVRELKRKLENLNQYLRKNMPTTQDIKNRQQSL